MNCGVVVSDMSDRIKTLVEEVNRLNHALEMNIKVGEKPPGESQVAIIKARIAALEREIAKANKEN
jgi:uncharacterized small protein (DUF1192 family)